MLYVVRGTVMRTKAPETMMMVTVTDEAFLSRLSFLSSLLDENFALASLMATVSFHPRTALPTTRHMEGRRE